jgi:hypothetical protein
MVGLSWLAAACGNAQVYRPIAPPPPVWPTPVRPHSPVERFDAFQKPPEEPLRLHPWQTLDIPPGSWGDINMWDGSQLNATTIKRFRQSFVQKVFVGAGFVNRGGQQNLGYTTLDSAITMVVPLGSADSLLVFTPRYESDWIDGPDFIDVPSWLQGIAIDIGWRYVFNPRWSLILGVQPGFYNDGVAENDTIRVGGLALLNCQVIEDRLSFSVGLVYLDQEDFSFVPGIGLTWLPNPDTRFDLNFPKPKIGRRISHIPFMLEDWVYVAASFGGGTWAVRRTSGVDDVLNLRDFRISAGFERVLDGGTGFFAEAGYVFARRLEYRSLPAQFDFTGSFILEAGLSF